MQKVRRCVVGFLSRLRTPVSVFFFFFISDQQLTVKLTSNFPVLWDRVYPSAMQLQRTDLWWCSLNDKTNFSTLFPERK